MDETNSCTVFNLVTLVVVKRCEDWVQRCLRALYACCIFARTASVRSFVFLYPVLPQSVTNSFYLHLIPPFFRISCLSVSSDASHTLIPMLFPSATPGSRGRQRAILVQASLLLSISNISGCKEIIRCAAKLMGVLIPCLCVYDAQGVTGVTVLSAMPP